MDGGVILDTQLRTVSFRGFIFRQYHHITSVGLIQLCVLGSLTGTGF